MVSGGRGVTIRLLLLLGLAVSAPGYVALRLWTGRGGALPPASWVGFLVLLFIAGGVFLAGLPVRRFLRGDSTKTLNPFRAMRTVALAQASALTGALVTGWYVAQILVLLPDLDVASRRALAWRLAALALGGLLMVVSGLVVQSMCRVDKDRSEADGDSDRRDGDGGEQQDRSREGR